MPSMKQIEDEADNRLIRMLIIVLACLLLLGLIKTALVMQENNQLREICEDVFVDAFDARICASRLKDGESIEDILDEISSVKPVK